MTEVQHLLRGPTVLKEKEQVSTVKNEGNKREK